MIRLMSNNQWKCDKNTPEWEAIGADCSAAVREKGFARMVEETMPDMLGLQEVSVKMITELMLNLKEKGLPYSLLWGRDTPIMYRADKFELLDSDFLIYPEEFAGYEGSFNNYKTKSYCLGLFREKATGKSFVFVSTHLWYQNEKDYPGSDGARAYQVRLAADAAEKVSAAAGNCPIVIVGDYNARYDSPAVQNLLRDGYVHAHDIATGERDEEIGHHYCFGNGYGTDYHGDFSGCIDHILLKNNPADCVVNFKRFRAEYYMPLSDHFPVWADINF